MTDNTTFTFDDLPVIEGFPELRWTGKRPYKGTHYYPAQLKESYGKASDEGWMNKIFWGDNLQVMSHMLKNYRGKIDLIYIDPPFDSVESCVDDPNKARNNFGSTFLKSNPNLTPQKLKILS